MGSCRGGDVYWCRGKGRGGGWEGMIGWKGEPLPS